MLSSKGVDPEESIGKRLYLSFSRDVLEPARASSAVADSSIYGSTTCVDESHLLSDSASLSGRPRTTLRNLLSGLVSQIDVQLSVANQLRLYQSFASDLQTVGEYVIAAECLELVLGRCDSVGDEFTATRLRAETVQKLVELKHLQLVGSSKYSRIAPIVVSQLLVVLQDLRSGSLEIIFELPTKQQEELAWLVLNGCKLLLKVAQPLVWLSCGKYVTDSIVFAGVCMESVINLCTARHLKFRMKVYASAYYATLVQGTTDESAKLLGHATNQVKEMREREELDLPVPDKVQTAMLEAETDLAVMRALHVFWNDSDSLDVADENAARLKYACPAAAKDTQFNTNTTTFAERCLAECARVQQLTAGNTNEPWRKRSSALLKACWKCLSTYPAPEASPSQSAFPELSSLSSTSVPSYPLSLECLVEMATVAIFDSTEGTSVPDVLLKLWQIAEVLQSSQPAAQEMALMKQLMTVTSMEAGLQRLAASIELAQMLNKLLYTSQVRRRQALLRRIAVGIWSRFIYPLLQQTLSEEQSSSTITSLIEMVPGLLAAVRTLDVTGIEDPVFIGSVSLTCSVILRHLGDLRASISLLRQALDTLDEHRAARVDVSLHMPEDVRDVSALQRASFTTRVDSSDWFHSIKRLGAHAFAGFGIFGASSSADRTDQALAELHTDMMALYFRFELEYAIKQKQGKTGYQAALRSRNVARGKPTQQNLPGTSDTTAAVTATGTDDANFVPPVTETAATENAEAFTKTILASATLTAYKGVATDSLRCVTAMKSWCGKNSYARCLLFLEMARVESVELKRLELLESARQCVEDAEAKEQVLKDTFQDLTILTNKEVRPPIVLARSHRFIYVAPVGSRKIVQKAKFYRIYAKQFGSGTSVSLANDDLPGCEKQVFVENMRTPASCAVKIERLRNGERYVFGYAAFAGQDKLIGGISPTTVGVDAVNPLPTILLWSFVNQVAFEVGALPQGQLAASLICQRFFHPVPRSPPIALGKGVNIFLDEDPAVCMLAVQQSSPLLLSNFVMAFLSLQVVIDKPPPGLGSVHFDLRKDAQIATLASLKRAALVSIMACYSMSCELVVRCVLLGYELASDLMLFDEMHLAIGLQGPLLMLLVALQTVPKRFWHDLEHKLYCRLLQHSVKLAILNRNMAAMVPVLSQFYPETESAADLVTRSNISPEIESQYLALKSTFKLAGGIVSSSAPVVESHTNSLLETPVSPANLSGDPEAPGELWKMSRARRAGIIQLSSTKILSGAAEGGPLLALLKEAPLVMSDVLSVLVVLGKEALDQGNPALLAMALASVPLYEKMFSPGARAANTFWELNLMQELPAGGFSAAMTAAAAAAAAAAALPAKGAKAATPAPAEPLDEAGGGLKPEVPLRFVETTAEEERRQLACLAGIASLRALTYSSAKREYYPKSLGGPEEGINPSLPSSFLAAEEPVDPNAEPDPAILAEIDFIKNLCAAISLFAKAEQANAAVHSAVLLWNYLVDKFMTPMDFAVLFKGNVDIILCTVSSLLSNLEALSGVDTSIIGSNQESGKIMVESVPPTSMQVTTGLPLRVVKENMYLVRNLSIFFVKVLWLRRKYLEAVDIGSRNLAMYVQKAPEFAKLVGDITLPLMIHAQEELIAAAEDVLAAKKIVMDACVASFEEFMKKKRRKKTRLVKVEKDDDELRHDAEVAEIQETVDAATNALDVCKSRLAALKFQQKRFDTLSSTGEQLLDKVRKQSQLLVGDCLQNTYSYGADGVTKAPGGDVDFAALLAAPALQERLELVLDQFEQVAHFLREKKDRNTLIESLKEQGDLLLLFGKIDAAKKIWHDGLDGFFNVMDAINQWQVVAQAALANLTARNVSGILPAVVMLGKLSRYCVPGDRDMKAAYCRMAAILCRAPFAESHGHPSTMAGFAAYVCRDLDGVSSLTANLNKLAPRHLALSLEEILQVLCAEHCRFDALPVVVLLEHLHAYYTCSPDRWLSARLMRVRLLIDAHLFAQAASMLASIKGSVLSILSRSHGNPLKTQLPPQAVEEFDTRENGFDFSGQAPFHNHLPPAHELNVNALAWIARLPEDFKQFSAAYIVQLPVPVLTEDEQRAKDEAAAAAAAAAAAEAAAKAKKGAKVAEPEAVATKIPTAPLFPAYLQREMMLVCAQMLVVLSISDAKITTSYSTQLSDYGTQGLDLIAKVKEMLAFSTSGAQAVPINDSWWISQFGRCNILQAKVLISRRKYKPVRASTFAVLEMLQKGAPEDGLFGAEAKFEMLDLWFAMREMSVEISERQARFQDVLKGATLAATEASSNCCGFWLRLALLRRGSVNYKLGNLKDALTDCEAIINIYRQNVSTDAALVRCLVLKVSVLREMNATLAPAKVVANTSACLGILREALKIAEALTKDAGFIGADANITFSRADTLVMKHHLLPSVLHNVTDIHPNDPALTLSAKLDAKKLAEFGGNGGGVQGGVTKKLRSEEDKDILPFREGGKWGSRQGPVDASETEFCQSEFANIHLPEVKCLAVVYGALCAFLDDVRLSGVQTNFDPRSRESFDNLVELDTALLLREQAAAGEDALKVLRHAVYVSPIMRSSLLLSVGKTRYTTLKQMGTASGPIDGASFLSPLRASLEIALVGPHPWEIMRSACIQLVECYADRSLDWGEDGEQRMKMALQYLICAVKVSNMQRTLTHDVVGLSLDKSFATVVPETITSILAAVTSSSATLPATAVKDTPIDPKAKVPTKGGQPTSTLAGPDGRDALFLLSAMIRESNPMWLDSFEMDDRTDLHLLLKKAFPVYAAKCTLSALPSLEVSSAMQIPAGAILSLYCSARMPEGFPDDVISANASSNPGLYSHVAAYFVLGARVPPGGMPAGVPAKNPDLTKIVLLRRDVVRIEKTLRDIKDDVADFKAKGYIEGLAKSGSTFARCLQLLFNLLSQGFIDSEDQEAAKLQEKEQLSETDKRNDATPRVVILDPTSPQGGIRVDFPASALDPINVALDDALLSDLADLFSHEKDMDAVNNAVVCSLLRGALGHE